MILDANILIYAVDPDTPHHAAARDWLTEALNGYERVGLPWQTIGAFLRITTNPRLFSSPLSAEEAADWVSRWMDADVTWVPEADPAAWAIYRTLSDRHQVTGNLVPDALLAAVALRHGVAVVSADTDFARFPELRWINPVG